MGKKRKIYMFDERSIADHIQDFRTERLSTIAACEELPVALDEKAPKIVLHMVPQNAFKSRVSLDLRELRDKADMMMVISAPGGQPPTSSRFNFDGVMRFSRDAYTQVFRNGIIEAVDTRIFKAHDERKLVPGYMIEKALLQAVKRYIGLQQFLNVESPAIIMMSLLGVKGYRLIEKSGEYMLEDLIEIDRKNLIIPESVIDTFENSDDQVSRIMKPIFDIVWNAVNYPFSPFYDSETGKYKNSF
jgi:hypothetical protein